MASSKFGFAAGPLGLPPLVGQYLPRAFDTGSITPAACAQNTSAAQTFTVTGLNTSDAVSVSGPAITAGLGIVGVRVSAANTLEITWGNFTGGSLTPAAGTYKVIAVKCVA